MKYELNLVALLKEWGPKMKIYTINSKSLTKVKESPPPPQTHQLKIWLYIDFEIPMAGVHLKNQPVYLCYKETSNLNDIVTNLIIVRKVM